MGEATSSRSKSTYENVLASLERGDRITFNQSGGANANPSPELTVVASGDPPVLESTHGQFEVRPNKNGGLVLYQNRFQAQGRPANRYAVIETIEVIAEGE